MTSNSSYSWSNFGSFSIQLFKFLGLKNVGNYVLKFMPEFIQKKIAELQAQNYLETHGTDAAIILSVDALKAKQQEALLYLIGELGADNIGDYLEFGVFSGTSLSCMFKVVKDLNLAPVRLFGFDSFEGMPDIAAVEDEGAWYPGQFKFSIEFTKGILTRRGIDWNRVFLTKGWFCDTLKPELRDRYSIKKASVIMVDCDLYSSTVEVLKFCEPLIQDQAILFFDDWNSYSLAEKDLGEKKAFDEFLQVNPQFTVKDFGRYEGHTACFIISRNH